MLRAIREIQPRWVVGENVRGLITWNGGLVFDEVQADLEAEGYEVLPFLLPASGVNAPHERYRIWFVAYNNKFDGNISGFRTSKISQFETSGVLKNITSNSASDRRIRTGQGIETKEGLQPRPEQAGQLEGRFEGLRIQRDITDTMHDGSQRSLYTREDSAKRWENENGHIKECLRFDRGRIQFDNFPTQSPVRSRNDGFSRPLFRYLNQEIYDRISTTSEENRIQNLPEVWEEIQQEKIWKKIRRFYSLESKDILLQTMRLYQTGSIKQNELSPFSEIVSETVLSKLRKYGEFRRSPQGHELQKQRSEQLGDIVSYLPHEIPLAAKTFETAMSKFETWHRNESIKAYGNAIVPQVVYQIFKAINHYEQTNY